MITGKNYIGEDLSSESLGPVPATTVCGPNLGERHAEKYEYVSEKSIEAISKAANTGKIGDGKIFVCNIEEAIRIRTQEKGDEAL